MLNKLYILGRNEAIVAVGEERLDPTAIVSITAPGHRVPPLFASWLGSKICHLAFDDVPRDDRGLVAADRTDVEKALEFRRSLSHPNFVVRDVIIHCAQGISRSTGVALAWRAWEARAEANGKDETRWREGLDRQLGAEQAVRHVIADVKMTHDVRMREDAFLLPNLRVVWLADQLLGYNGHLLKAVAETFRCKDIWASLGETAPVTYPGTHE